MGAFSSSVMESVWLSAVCVAWVTGLLWLFAVSESQKKQKRNGNDDGSWLSPFPVNLKVTLLWLFITPVFFFSAVVIALAQCACRLMFFLPLTQRLGLSQSFGYYCWCLTLFILEFYANVEFRLCTPDSSRDHSIDARTLVRRLFSKVTNHNTMSLINHEASELDWVAPMAFAHRFGLSARAFGVMKLAMAFFPAIGWSGFLCGGVVLYRSAAVDFPRLAKLLPRIGREYPRPWSFTFYPEGTRQTPAKLAASQKFAESRGLARLEHIMQPRVKGFCFFVEHLRGSLDLIMDLSVVYKPKPPKFADLYRSGYTHASTDIYVRLYPVKDLPKEHDELSQWLYDRWTEKDQLSGVNDMLDERESEVYMYDVHRIIDSMKKDEFEMRPMLHAPFESGLTYSLFTFLFVLYFRWFWDLRDSLCLWWLITALFPLWIVHVQFDHRRRSYRKATLHRKSMEMEEETAETIISAVKQEMDGVLDTASALMTAQSASDEVRQARVESISGMADALDADVDSALA